MLFMITDEDAQDIQLVKSVQQLFMNVTRIWHFHLATVSSLVVRYT